ncbi:MAG: flagellar hook-basal body complex protein, partial [Burkholderiaceae bacterium]|nr:flagellar hook-basal body complex protein [Burkholderiaceae bacterium]
QFNSSGVLTDSTGKLNVQALGANGQLTDLTQGTLENNPAKASTAISLEGNLSTATGSTNQISTITVYDANGGSHTLTATFTQSATAGTWTVAILDGTTPVQSGGSFVFTNGAISATDSFNFTYSPAGAPAMNLSLSLAATSTSNANAAQLSVKTVDGNAAGSVTNVAFNQNGTMVLNYSNGQTANGPTVALANFASTADLHEAGSGNNAFTVANNSEAQLGTAGSASAWGSITSDAIEASNVDLSTEFSEIIITQRGYQAASELISTANQMIQNLLEMKGQG